MTKMRAKTLHGMAGLVVFGLCGLVGVDWEGIRRTSTLNPDISTPSAEPFMGMTATR